ncbi:YeeE/YedE family protein [Humitalea sp. 24SJ18S-53]|uniref:YeeE/YedE family protein n=1 Tax=Humitalea sp. 24SJ18S-53 TaxID=3422307 RepID=UPI003D66B27A
MAVAVKLGLAAAMLLVGAWTLGAMQGWRMAVLWCLGAGLGLVLFRASFGFAGAFRRLILDRRGLGLRAQMVMLGLAVCLFLPVLEAGSLFGTPVRGFVFPLGVALLLGAFLFGIGMQLGGGCGSGTLYAAGGGQESRMWITLAAFIAGATLAAWQGELWLDWPALPAISLLDRLGAGRAIALSLAVFALVWCASAIVEQRRHGGVEALQWRGTGRMVWRGPWLLVWGAVALAVLNFATLAIAGRPWAITAAFPLWGSRGVEFMGWDEPAFWTYWEDPTRTEALLRPLVADRIGVMDLGLMLGAFCAAALARRPADWRLPRPGAVAASVVGGLLLGIGATLGSGCNISAYFGGIASGSLHGWVWILPALAGNWVGVRLRPAFGLDTSSPI